MVWNLIKYKYKYKYAVFVFVFVFANTNTYLTPALVPGTMISTKFWHDKHPFSFTMNNDPCMHEWWWKPRSNNYPSCATKGFAMASMPSAGQMRTTDVPRHTTRPSSRVSSVSLYGSSGSTMVINYSYMKRDLGLQITKEKSEVIWNFILLSNKFFWNDYYKISIVTWQLPLHVL